MVKNVVRERSAGTMKLFPIRRAKPSLGSRDAYM
jgi:hypothetical protein